MILLAAYDLHQPGRDYGAIEALLKSASGGFFHLQGSVWLLDTAESPKWWRDELRSRGDANDEYFVTLITRSWAGLKMDGGGKWLKDPDRSW